jgi:hypothetical protein
MDPKPEASEFEDLATLTEFRMNAISGIFPMKNGFNEYGV